MSRNFVYKSTSWGIKQIDNLQSPVEQIENGSHRGTWGFGEFYNYPSQEEAAQAQQRLRDVVKAVQANYGQPHAGESQEEYTRRMTSMFPFTG